MCTTWKLLPVIIGSMYNFILRLELLIISTKLLKINKLLLFIASYDAFLEDQISTKSFCEREDIIPSLALLSSI